ncbi:hypothetical protein HUJ05_004592 [Dendroctonus ponderosae]|nr:hypothetical protein HUJ05_004592 [Dendroctonus ponderosae]
MYLERRNQTCLKSLKPEPQLYLVKTQSGLQVIFDNFPPKTPLLEDTRTLPDSGLKRRTPDQFSHKSPKIKSLCQICGKFFSSSSHRHHKNDFVCSICFLTVKSEKALVEHGRIHLTEHYQCDKCPSIFKTLADLSAHNFAHTGTYTCLKCGKSFKGRRTLRNHVSNEVENFKYTCVFCGKGFVKQHIFQAHIETHESVRKYQCNICQKTFKLKSYLQTHERLNHKMELLGVDVVFNCKYCSRGFTFECSLKRHLNLIHKIGTMQKMECSICSKTFTTRYSLTVHMRLHTGVKKFECSVCGEKFARKQYTDRHMARVHST